MKKLTTIIFAAIAICFSITTDTFAQSVTAEFMTYGADGTTLNKVRMDQPGVPYSDGVDRVSALFYSGDSRDLVIRLDGSRTRTAVFDFTEVSSNTNAPAWIYSSPLQSFKPQMNVLQAYYAKERCQPDAGGVYNCNFVTRMNAGYLYASGDRATYALLWNPETQTPRPVNSPEKTSFVNVNYQKDALGNEVFTITPLPNSDSGRIIAGLEKTSGRTVSSAGQYVMPFTLVVRPK